MSSGLAARSIRLWPRAVGVAMLAGLILPRPAAASDPPAKVVVAWDNSSTGDARIRRFPAAAPWDFDVPELTVGANITLRLAGDLLYAVSRTHATVAVIDPDEWTILRTLSVGAGREPVDIAVVAPDLAYISCVDETHLLRFNAVTGQTALVVDLSIFADADGIPDMNMMAVHEGRLFVQIRRVDSSTFAFVPPAMLAVVDLASEQLIDVDPGTPGIQAIELQGMAPKLKMQVVEATRRLVVSASGDFFDAGGIELIDLDTLQSLGLVVHETDGQTGADIGAFVLVAPDRGYLTFTTDFAVSSHMVEFTIPGGVVPGGALFETVGYFVPTLPLDSQSSTIFFPDAGSVPAEVHVLDASSAAHLATVTIGADAYPTDVVVVPAAPAIPAASSWGLVIFLLLLASAAGAIMVHRQSRLTAAPG